MCRPAGMDFFNFFSNAKFEFYFLRPVSMSYGKVEAYANSGRLRKL
jgi:hypothetical protein